MSDPADPPYQGPIPLTDAGPAAGPVEVRRSLAGHVALLFDVPRSPNAPPMWIEFGVPGGSLQAQILDEALVTTWQRVWPPVPDDAAYCARSCGRLATRSVLVGLQAPEVAGLLPEGDRDGPVEDRELFCDVHARGEGDPC